MEQLLLFPLADMLIVVGDLIPGLFLFGVIGSQGLVEDLMVDLFQIIVAKSHILLRPAPVYIQKSHSAPSGSDLHWPLKSSGYYAGCCPGQSCRK